MKCRGIRIQCTMPFAFVDVLKFSIKWGFFKCSCSENSCWLIFTHQAPIDSHLNQGTLPASQTNLQPPAQLTSHCSTDSPQLLFLLWTRRRGCTRSCSTESALEGFNYLLPLSWSDPLSLSGRLTPMSFPPSYPLLTPGNPGEGPTLLL